MELWFRSRTYLHFDRPVSYAFAEKYVKNPNLISKHSFFPFLNYKISSFKVGQGVDNKVHKKPPKERIINYASHLDSQIYSYYSQLINDRYEDKVSQHSLDANILAFRALGKSNVDFANQAFDSIASMGKCSAIALDISGFFDNLDHDALKSSVAHVLEGNLLSADMYAVLKSLCKYSYVSRDVVYSEFGISRNNAKKKGRYRICSVKEFRNKVRKGRLIKKHDKNFGIPQGTPISALLSNVYMLDFDILCKNTVDEIGGLYYRYCDDLLFVTPQEHELQVIDLVKDKISNLKLSINEKKTEVRHFNFKDGQLKSDKPLQYLGFTFDGQRKLIRSAALARFSGKMNAGIRQVEKKWKKECTIRLSKGQQPAPLYKKKVFERYSHLGNRNFVTYALRSAKTMKSKSIKKQIRPYWDRLNQQLKELEESI